MKFLNLKNNIKIKHEIENIIFDNFDNLTLSSLSTIFSFISDDLINLIDDNDDVDDELIEIFYDDIYEFIKDNLKNYFHLYNIIPIYKNDDELINLIHINNIYDLYIDNNNIIQYKSIMNFLNSYDEFIYDINKNEFDDLLLNDKFDVGDYFNLFYDIEFINNNKYKFNHYEFLFDDDDIFVTYEIIDKFKLVKIFYKYFDKIVENIVDEINDDIKRYFKGSLLI